jgi:hypothetical protein
MISSNTSCPPAQLVTLTDVDWATRADAWRRPTLEHFLGFRQPPQFPESPALQCRPESRLDEIEISPGVEARVRGSTETEAAIVNGYYDPVDFACCEASLYVIRDAGYVLCPACKVISLAPMRSGAPRALADREFNEAMQMKHRIAGGVGLGIDLAEFHRVLQRGMSWKLRREFTIGTYDLR